MILVNKLKINLETVAYFTQKENDILNFIRNELKDLTIFTHEFYPENIFYFNSNNEIILLIINIYFLLSIRKLLVIN